MSLTSQNRRVTAGRKSTQVNESPPNPLTFVAQTWLAQPWKGLLIQRIYVKHKFMPPPLPSPVGVT